MRKNLIAPLFFLGLSVLSSCSTTTQEIYDPNQDFTDVQDSKVLKPNQPVVVDGVEINNLEFDLPVLVNPAVEKWVRYFRTRGRDLFERYLDRGSRYHTIISNVLMNHGLPRDLFYVALIESGFNKSAVSRAAAVGPWQFIRSTGRLYGLKSDQWVEERRDIEKSSAAAARFFLDLYGQFGNWELATAAYNAGPAKINNAIRRFGTNDFWKLRRSSYIRHETDNYVPKWMAAAIIDKNREAFGFDHVSEREASVWDTIEIKKSIDLYQLAEKINASYAELRDINPELKHWTTPPVSSYQLRVPKGLGEQALAAVDNINTPQQEVVKYHKVRPGDSLLRVANLYQVPYQKLKTFNQIDSDYLLKKGQILRIPSSSSSISKLSKEEIKARASAYDTFGSIVQYRVRRGDTISTIARKFHVSQRNLKDANRIKSHIYVGQRLNIPTSGGGSAYAFDSYREPRSVEESKEKERNYKIESRTYTAVKADTQDPEDVVHVVRRGETLSSIAKKYDVPASAIKKANRLRSTRLRKGQELVIPSSGTQVKVNSQQSKKKSPQTLYSFHRVRRGDNLSTIAKKYQTSSSTLRKINNLKSEQVNAGQLLKIPNRI